MHKAQNDLKIVKPLTALHEINITILPRRWEDFAIFEMKTADNPLPCVYDNSIKELPVIFKRV